MDLVQQNYHSAQKPFSAASSTVRDYQNWSEGQLRKFLLEQKVISPKSTREELIVIAKGFEDKMTGAWASVTSAAGEAKETAEAVKDSATETLSGAWYAATNAPSQAYDYVSEAVSGSFLYLGRPPFPPLLSSLTRFAQTQPTRCTQVGPKRNFTTGLSKKGWLNRNIKELVRSSWSWSTALKITSTKLGVTTN